MNIATLPHAQLEYLPPEQLVAYGQNARRHSKKQIRQIAESIQAFGFNAPVLINAHNVLLAGHGRVEAARLLGLETIPCLRLEHMSEDQQRGWCCQRNLGCRGAGWATSLLG